MEKENWDPDFQPPKKKARHTKVTIDKRFAKAKTVDEVADITKGFVSPNTAKNTTWAMQVFEEWRCVRNKNCTGDEICGANLLESPHIDSLNFWMPCFIAEVRRQDGKPYPPKIFQNESSRKQLDTNLCKPYGAMKEFQLISTEK